MTDNRKPAGDVDLTSGGRPPADEQIRDGGVGPSGSDATSTGREGGLGNTADGKSGRLNGESDRPPAARMDR